MPINFRISIWRYGEQNKQQVLSSIWILGETSNTCGWFVNNVFKLECSEHYWGYLWRGAICLFEMGSYLPICDGELFAYLWWGAICLFVMWSYLPICDWSYLPIYYVELIAYLWCEAICLFVMWSYLPICDGELFAYLWWGAICLFVMGAIFYMGLFFIREHCGQPVVLCLQFLCNIFISAHV